MKMGKDKKHIKILNKRKNTSIWEYWKQTLSFEWKWRKMKNEEASQNLALYKKSHQRVTHKGRSLCKLLSTILKIDLEWSQTNRTNSRNLMVIKNALLQRNNINRLYESGKKEGRGLTSIKNCVDTSRKKLKNWIKKSKERVNTSTNNNSGNISTKAKQQKKRKKKKNNALWLFQAIN